jgi:hypothetical protein
MNQHAEITIPQTSIALTFAASSRDRIVHAIKNLGQINTQLPAEQLAERIASHQDKINARLDQEMPKIERFFNKAVAARKLDSYSIEGSIDRITQNHKAAHALAIAYGLTCVSSIHSLQSILHESPYQRHAGLMNSLMLDLKRFDSLVDAELETIRLSNPHIHIDHRNFLINNIETGAPDITFNPPRD